MRKVKLGDISEIITGPFGSMLHKSDYRDEGIPVIMPQDIANRVLSFANIARIGQKDASRLARYATVADDIVYARRGDVEKHAFISEEEAGALCGTGCLRVRVNRNLAEPLYVSFLLNTSRARTWIRRHAVGSNMPNINTDILGALPLELPAMKVQKSVSQILRAVDDKIANNKKLMVELEETARLIYDYWFTQFDFPDENGHPYRSSGGAMIYNETLKREIPVGWEAVNVASMVSVTKGVSYKSEDLLGDGIPMVNLASFEVGGGFKVSGTKSYSGKVDSRRTAVPGDLLMCVTQQTALDLTGNTNVLGKAFRLPDCFTTEVVISTDVVKLVPEDSQVGVFLEYLFARPEVHKRIIGFANGTKIKHLDVGGALDFAAAMPSARGAGKYALEQYALFADDVHAKMSRLIRENEELLTLRNRLLPMLMNGQVEVRGVVGLSGDGARS